MYGLISLLLLMQHSGGAEPVAPATAPATAPAPVSYVEGPLRVELLTLAENRLKSLDESAAQARQSDLRMQFRVRGEQVDRVARISPVVFSEAVDDRGESLLDPEGPKPEDLFNTRLVNLTPDRIRTTGLVPPTSRLNPPARAATKITRLRAELRVVLADAYESVTIDNPRQFAGRLIEHPRLKELGVEIRVAQRDEVDKVPTEDAILLQFPGKRDSIRRVSFFDASMRPLRSREFELVTHDGKPVTAYMVERNAVGPDSQIVFEVFTATEERRLPIAIDDLELP